MQEEEVEQVDSHRNLRILRNIKILDWSHTTEDLTKHTFLMRLKSFSVCNRHLTTFYQFVITSALFFSVEHWGYSVKTSRANRLKNLRKASCDVGLELESLEAVVQRKMKDKIKTISHLTLCTTSCGT